MMAALPNAARLASCRSSALARAISSCTRAETSAVAEANSCPRLRPSPLWAALIASSVVLSGFPRSSAPDHASDVVRSAVAAGQLGEPAVFGGPAFQDLGHPQVVAG